MGGRVWDAPSVAIGMHWGPSGRAWWWACAPAPVAPHQAATGSPSGVAGISRNQAWSFFFFLTYPAGLTAYAPREKLEFFSDRADNPADLTPRGGILPKSVVIFFRGGDFWEKTVIIDKKGQ